MTEQHAATSSLFQRVARFAMTLALVAGVSSFTARAFADEQAAVKLAAFDEASDGSSEPAGLNRPLMIVGATLFAGSYLPSAAFATLGDWDADNALVVPVAGPWMALANADNKPLSRALLINSGVMQGVGVLSMVMSLVVPNYGSSTTLRFGKSEVQVSPTHVSGNGYGVGAVGSF